MPSGAATTPWIDKTFPSPSGCALPRRGSHIRDEVASPPTAISPARSGVFFSDRIRNTRTTLRIKAGSYDFEAQTEDWRRKQLREITDAALPAEIIHVRAGAAKACWIRSAELTCGWVMRNEPSHPAPGRKKSPLSRRHQRDGNSAGLRRGVVSRRSPVSGNHGPTIPQGREKPHRAR